ncbi:MAG: glycoside hydrolase family 31 protein, partial [Lachnospiraceae bacterium]|nr:glycoside hydrolase family 31 protein [Lachnospiraceae bacterium]
WIYFDWQENEELYGLGQHEEGFGSLRGQTVYVHQGNRKIAVPFLVSTLGYGLLIDTYSPLVFNDTPHGSYIYSEAVPEIDYYFMNGGSMEHSVKAYRQLTGKAAMLPKWAFGYIQSKERYENAEELLNAAMEYRSRGIGLDCIVLDWMYWEDGKWGQKSFDRTRFPEPGNMIGTLHKNNVRFMISVWPNMSEQAENRAEFETEGELMLPCSDLYNAFSPDAEKLYWKQASKGLFQYGIDAWWCDNCEPFAPEWLTNIRPLPHRQFEMYTEQSSDHIPAELTNAYALFHTRGICLGQREECEDKRVVILARSGYTGQQRYSSILWSGDIAASWDTLSRQIAAGLGLCASGIPYWTVDIGAFFVKNGLPWYWKGDYDNTVDSAEYRELFVRWYQWAAFLPVFRGHGTDCDRELWQFEDADGRYYDTLVKANRLRYEFMPYIYSLAGRTWLDDESMMRYLAFDYPDDKTACGIKDQYMFGDSIMVCPVHEKQSVSGGIKKIYLPAGGWYDLSGNQYYEGGGWIEKMVPLDEIPLFVRAGGILVKTESALSTQEQSRNIEVCIYGGADGAFKLYDDDGDGYDYENGRFKTAVIRWEDKEGRLSVTGTDFLEGRDVSCCLISRDGSRRTLQISR